MCGVSCVGGSDIILTAGDSVPRESTNQAKARRVCKGSLSSDLTK